MKPSRPSRPNQAALLRVGDFGSFSVIVIQNGTATGLSGVNSGPVQRRFGVGAMVGPGSKIR
jgi:hypothetical protein